MTGRPYAAGDPALLLWVHGALVDSVLAAGNLVGTALPAADSNRYVAEMVTAAELTGLLGASPAAISGAVRYLEQVGMIGRQREPGSRRDVYLLRNDLWYEISLGQDQVLAHWANAAGDGAEILGPDTPADAVAICLDTHGDIHHVVVIGKQTARVSEARALEPSAPALINASFHSAGVASHRTTTARGWPDVRSGSAPNAETTIAVPAARAAESVYE